MSRSSILGFGTSFEAKRWLSLDPCGILGIALSWGVHIYALVVIPLHVLDGSLLSNLVYYFFYIPCALLAMASLFMASTTNPGAVPFGARPLLTIRRASSSSLMGGSGALGSSTTTTITDGDNNSGNSNIRESLPPSRAVRRCHKCRDNFKPARAHHDSVTDRCIVKFDHFCPWVNNAVGAMNHKFFCLFLLYTAVTCMLSLLLLLMRLLHCVLAVASSESSTEEEIKKGAAANTIHDIRTDIDPNSNHSNRLLADSYPSESAACDGFYQSNLVLGLFLASLIFLIFTMSMGCEQLEAIETGKGKIARMKMSIGENGTQYARATEEFNEMFGGDSPHPSWHWFLPVAVTFPRGMKKVVLGYDWDESSYMATRPYQEDDLKSSSSDSGDHELNDVELGRHHHSHNRSAAAKETSNNDMSLAASSLSAPSAATAAVSVVPPESSLPPILPMRSSIKGMERESSSSSDVGGVKNRRPRNLDEPRELV